MYVKTSSTEPRIESLFKMAGHLIKIKYGYGIFLFAITGI